MILLSPPVRYTADVETVEPDEAETIARLNASFDEILDTTAEDYGHAVRAVHAKAHAILEAVLTIDDALPPELAQGLFAQPGRHRALIRISTNPGDILDDAISVPRGFALKVLDVEGGRLPGAQGSTQDFILVNGPVFQSKTPKAFAGNLALLAKTTDKAEGGKKALSAVLRGINTALTAVGVESPKVQSLGGAPQVHPLGETYYSVTPFRFGDYIAKFSIAPVSPDLTRHTKQQIDVSGRPDGIRETMRADMRSAHAVWELRVQLNRDLDDMPIEDPTVQWDEEKSPFVRVALLEAEPQDSWSPQLVEEVDNRERFSVWTGLAAHQPLGGINRARRETYDHSASFRARVNGCPMREPG